MKFSFASSSGISLLTIGSLGLSGIPAAKAAAAFTVNTTLEGSQTAVDIANLGAGGFVVVWQGPDGDGSGVFGRRYAADGSPIANEFRVNRSITGAQFNPKVASDGRGRYAITFTSTLPGGTPRQMVRRYNAGNDIDDSPINLPISFSNPSLSMAPDGTTALVGYGASTPNEDGEPIRLRAFSMDTTSPLSPEVTIGTGSDFSDRSTDVCYHSDESFAIVYTSPISPNFEYQVTLARFGAKGEPLEPTTFASGGDSEAAELGLACLADGSYAVTYSDLLEGVLELSSVFVQRISSAGLPLGGPQQISDTTTPRGANGSAPDIAAVPTGGYDLVWSRYLVLEGDSENPDAFEFQIQGQRFQTDGSPGSSRLRIDQAPFSTARARYPAVSSNAISSQPFKSFGVWQSGAGPTLTPTDISGRVLP